MKIAIVTMYLHTNYGGLLQAYALKKMLEDMGHEATVLDLERKVWFPPAWKAPLVYAKRSLFRLIKGDKGPEVFREFRLKREFPIISSRISRFTEQMIRPRVLTSYSQVKESDYEAFVVGSDQVWRPMCFEDIYDAFLRFTKGWNVGRVSYAASFGTTDLEFDYSMMEECAALLEKFDGVSVREDSGVQMCSQWLDCDKAVHVLDPVLMHSGGFYSEIASKAESRPSEGCVVTYILDRSDVKRRVADFVSKATGMKIHDISVYPKDRNIPLEERVVEPMEDWIAGFRYSSFVVTDSFHGCVMSILFHKPFVVIGNRTRGLARIDSLLRMFGLEGRLVEGIDPDDDGKDWLMDFDWERIDAVLDKNRRLSWEFLKSALESDGATDPGEIEEK